MKEKNIKVGGFVDRHKYSRNCQIIKEEKIIVFSFACASMEMCFVPLLAIKTNVLVNIILKVSYVI